MSKYHICKISFYYFNRVNIQDKLKAWSQTTFVVNQRDKKSWNANPEMHSPQATVCNNFNSTEICRVWPCPLRALSLSITDSVDMSVSKLWEIVKDREPGVLQVLGHRVRHDLVAEQQQQQ